jgi:glycogen debranching enzyme
MGETIRLEDEYYILATQPSADTSTRVLKQGESFGVFDRHGDIQSGGLGQEGLYHEGTRFLSHLLFTFAGARPFLLDSIVTDDNLLFTVHLTNPDVYRAGEVALPRGTLYVSRSKLLRDGVCYEEWKFTSFARAPVDARFSVEYGADFADVFEVRGMQRPRRGRLLGEQVEGAEIRLGYEGLDGEVRRTRILFSAPPARIERGKATFHVHLEPHDEVEFVATYAFENGEARRRRSSYGESYWEAQGSLRRFRLRACEARSSNRQFNEWLDRSFADLHMMLTETDRGLYPYAGVPWFNTPFGRDGIITAFETLWACPEIARGVLLYLAAEQAQEEEPERDAEPGKILHESRRGEMARLGEIPFSRYYGSVDATPLFVVLAGAYLERTADTELLGTIWPAIGRALGWIDAYGDRDRDGFVEYERRSSKGLLHQGWKDSWDAVFHEDGELAEEPIALCEVQGYVYAAKLAGAKMAALLGEEERADDLRRQAAKLRDQFERSFWCADLQTYALALDGQKRPCRVRTSNAGHCLWAGIASEERAAKAADSLMAEDSFSGWGVRTVAASAARYNPMSYHNGSIWPHDNALIAAGLARYGLKEYANRIFRALFDASRAFELCRLPELYCGFARRSGEGPVPYPVACSPQAWAAGAVFLLLQASLGMGFQADRPRLSFRQPLLPDFLDELTLRNLRVGPATVDLLIRRHFTSTEVHVERRDGNIEVVIER